MSPARPSQGRIAVLSPRSPLERGNRKKRTPVGAVQRTRACTHFAGRVSRPHGLRDRITSSSPERGRIIYQKLRSNAIPKLKYFFGGRVSARDQRPCAARRDGRQGIRFLIYRGTIYRGTKFPLVRLKIPLRQPDTNSAGHQLYANNIQPHRILRHSEPVSAGDFGGEWFGLRG